MLWLKNIIPLTKQNYHQCKLSKKETDPFLQPKKTSIAIILFENKF